MNIKFNKKKHTYTYDKDEYISVTTLTGRYFNKFDAKEIARKLSKFPINKKNKHGVRYWLNLWKKQQEYGTYVHADIEISIKLGITPDTKEGVNAINYLDNYLRKLTKPTLLPEFIIFNKSYKIAGTSDLCILHSDNVMTIIDWKVVKEIKKNGFKGVESKIGTPDSNYWKYCIQLNMYAKLLMLQGYKIDKLIILQLLPGGVKEFEVPGMISEVNKILVDRAKELEEK